MTQTGPLEYHIVGQTLGAATYGYDVTITLDEIGGSYTGSGLIDGGAWAVFVTGRRVG